MSATTTFHEWRDCEHITSNDFLRVEACDDMTSWDISILDLASESASRPVIDDMSITQEFLRTDTMNFSMYPNHPYYGQLQPYKTYIRAIWYDPENAEYGDYEFVGRVISSTFSMNNSGQVVNSITCEAAEAFLMDTTFDSTALLSGVSENTDGTYSVPLYAYVQAILEQHNVVCDTPERIQMGYFMPFSNSEQDYYPAPWTYGTVSYTAISDVCDYASNGWYSFTALGNIGEVFAPYVHFNENNVLVLDILTVRERGFDHCMVTMDDEIYAYPYVSSGGGAAALQVNLGENLGDIGFTPDYTNVVSTLKPMGEEIEVNGVKSRIPLSAYEAAAGGAFEWDFPATSDGTFVTKNSTQALYGQVTEPLVLEGYADVDDDNGTYTISLEQGTAFLNRVARYLSNHGEPTYKTTMTLYDLKLATGNRYDYSAAHFPIGKQIWGNLPFLPSEYDELERVNVPTVETYIVRRILNLKNLGESQVELGSRIDRNSNFTTNIAKTVKEVSKVTSEVAKKVGLKSSSNVIDNLSRNSGIATTTDRIGCGATIGGGGDSGGCKLLPINSDQIHMVFGDYFSGASGTDSESFGVANLKLPARCRTYMTVRFYYALICGFIFGMNEAKNLITWYRTPPASAGTAPIDDATQLAKGYIGIGKMAQGYNGVAGTAWAHKNAPFVITDVSLIQGVDYYMTQKGIRAQVANWGIGFEDIGFTAHGTGVRQYKGLPFLQVTYELTNYTTGDFAFTELGSTYTAAALGLCFSGFLQDTKTSNSGYSIDELKAGLDSTTFYTQGGQYTISGNVKGYAQSGAKFADFKRGMALNSSIYNYCIGCGPYGAPLGNAFNSPKSPDAPILGNGAGTAGKFVDSTGWNGYNIDTGEIVKLYTA